MYSIRNYASIHFPEWLLPHEWPDLEETRIQIKVLSTYSESNVPLGYASLGTNELTVQTNLLIPQHCGYLGTADGQHLCWVNLEVILYSTTRSIDILSP